MAYLHNKNGIDYKILNSRNSVCYKGHKDYIVENPKSRAVSIVHGWKPKKGEWEHSRYYGQRNEGALRRARSDFKLRKY